MDSHILAISYTQFQMQVWKQHWTCSTSCTAKDCKNYVIAYSYFLPPLGSLLAHYESIFVLVIVDRPWKWANISQGNLISQFTVITTALDRSQQNDPLPSTISHTCCDSFFFPLVSTWHQYFPESVRSTDFKL